MQYGICSLSLISVRSTADPESKMISQLLYGDCFKILESRKHFSRIRKAFDAFEGWIPNNQFIQLKEDEYSKLDSSHAVYAADLVSFIETDKGSLQSILMGSSLKALHFLKHKFDGKIIEKNQPKATIITTAHYYLETPFLDGGLSPFGIDSAGFTQMVYRINGYQLKRTPELQATQGDALSFIEESEPGDLAFFDNAEGVINHVGIIMADNYIIHVNGKVRIDRIDHTGIFNAEKGNYTHELRVIKKIL